MDEFLKNTLTPMSFVDCTGIERQFYLKGHYSEEINLYSLFAREILDFDEEGYYFQSYSYSSPQEARSRLVHKIRYELSRKYLDPNNKSHLLNRLARGRVSSGGVVIDGIFISWSEFSAMMQTHEGWEFELDFREM